jgi:hypothetical protein
MSKENHITKKINNNSFIDLKQKYFKKKTRRIKKRYTNELKNN